MSTPSNDREKIKLLNRVRRLRGQLDAAERSLNGKDDCADVLMLLAAIRGGVNGLMAEVMEDHIRHHLAEGGEAQRPLSPELAEDLIDLLRSYLK